MSEPAGWETWLGGRFPGYLLPDSHRHALTAEEAGRFLARLTGRPGDLRSLLAVSLLKGHEEDLVRFVSRELPAVVRVLPQLTERVRLEQEGGFRGRLDIRATLALHAAGHETRFVASVPRRHFDRPENLLLVWVARRLHGELSALRESGLLPRTGYGQTLSESADRLHFLLEATILRQVSTAILTERELTAAKAARHPAYASASAWWHLKRHVLEGDDPRRNAEAVAEGALWPTQPETRFEIAVVLRLVEALVHRLVPRGFLVEHGLIHAKRHDVCWLTRGDDVVTIHYNQAALGPGPSDQAARHYLGQQGTLRPDVLVSVSRGGSERSMVFEVKHTDSDSYARQGFEEAAFYRYEFCDRLLAEGPQAVLVVSSDRLVRGAPRVSDRVIAVGWGQFVPEMLLDTLERALRAP